VLIPISHSLDLNTKCKLVSLLAIEFEECKTPCLFCWYMFLMQPCVLFVPYVEQIFKTINWTHLRIKTLAQQKLIVLFPMRCSDNANLQPSWLALQEIEPTLPI
jgi:hypothetical protein